MYCKYCNGNGNHHHQCPNYSKPFAKHCCSICEDGIYYEEEYIVNEDGIMHIWNVLMGLKIY